MLSAFPLDTADAFTLRPLLLGSRPIANGQLRDAQAIQTAFGNWQPGDTFLLMSDALAANFLSHTGPPLAAVAFDGTQQGFGHWIRALRKQGELRNDDVSLVWLRVGPDAPA